MTVMKRAGVGEARQNLSALIDEVRRGHEVIITERGRPVARLVPPLPPAAKAFRGRTAFRRGMPRLKAPVSLAVIDGREERG
jgi:prevent-host-death family protein